MYVEVVENHLKKVALPDWPHFPTKSAINPAAFVVNYLIAKSDSK